MARKKKGGEETVAMGVRLTTSQRADLEAIAEKNDVDVADLIRWAVKALLAHIERSGGRLVLPVDFSENIQVFRVVDDGRSELQSLRAAEHPGKYPAEKEKVIG